MSTNSENSSRIYEKLLEIEEQLEHIRKDTGSLNRIASLANTSLIIEELKRLVGRSEIKAATLHLTKDLIGPADLSAALGIDSGNLARTIEPFLTNGYVLATRRGRIRYYQRSELLDLIGFENIPEFTALIRSWNLKKKQQSLEKTFTNDSTTTNTSPQNSESTRVI